MKVYEVSIDKTNYIDAISLVEYPAIESDFIFMGKEDKPIQQVFLESDEKYMIYGPVLIPNKLIYRYDADTGEEYYIKFTEESIKNLAYRFTHYDFHRFTEDHESGLSGDEIKFVESWIIEDPENDKSNAIGLKGLSKGTWVIGSKVNSIELWERIKNNRVKGFSVEAFVNVNEVENKINQSKEEMKENSLEKLGKMIQEMYDEFKKEFKGGKTEETLSNENVEVHTEEVEVNTETEENVVNQENTEVVTEQVEENTEVATEQVEEVHTETEEAQVVEEAPVVENVETPNAEVEQLRSQLQERENEINDLKQKLEKLSKKPSTEPVGKEKLSKTDNPMDIIEALRNGTYFKK